MKHSWLLEWCSQNWREATIISFLKKGERSSGRPIGLMSTIGKVLERMIANRLSWCLETNAIFSPWQAGFQKGRSTTDQCFRLSQFISEGLQSSQRKRTVVTFFDLSKAYYRVWQKGLLLNMTRLGVLLRFYEWLASWFTNRTA